MKKKVKDGERVTTFQLDGTECAVTFSRDFPVFEVRAENDVIVALESGKTAEDDGVMLCEGGCSVTYTHKRSIDTVYITGTGKVTVVAREEPAASFNILGKGGDVTAQGNPVTLNGLQEGVPFSEVTVSGKNLIRYPYYDGASKTLNGITFTVSPDGSITVNGTATSDAGFYIDNTITLLAGVHYVLSGAPTSTITSYRIQLADSAWNTIFACYGEPVNVMVEQDTRFRQFRILVSKGSVCDNVVFKPMVELGDTATEYVSPITGQELTVNANGVDYTIIPDSNPYIVPAEIYQQSGNNTLSVSGEGEPTLSVTGIRKNAAVKKIWDKLNELTTAIIVSNGEI